MHHGAEGRTALGSPARLRSGGAAAAQQPARRRFGGGARRDMHARRAGTVLWRVTTLSKRPHTPSVSRRLAPRHRAERCCAALAPRSVTPGAAPGARAKAAPASPRASCAAPTRWTSHQRLFASSCTVLCAPGPLAPPPAHLFCPPTLGSGWPVKRNRTPKAHTACGAYGCAARVQARAQRLPLQSPPPRQSGGAAAARGRALPSPQILPRGSADPKKTPAGRCH